MVDPVSKNFKSVEIVRKVKNRRSDASLFSDEQTYQPDDNPSSNERLDPSSASSDVDVRIIRDHPPILVSTEDPSKRRPNYKLPTPDSEWRPEWRPRKRPPGLRQSDRSVLNQVTTEVMVGTPDIPVRLPADPETGRVVKSPELLEALCDFLSQGGMMLTFAKRVGLSRSTLSTWCTKDPEWKAKVARARDQGVDALAEEALTISSETLMVEDVYESYDEKGRLQRRDVRKSDAVHARKLAVNTRLELLKKWAPQKYGDKVEDKTDSSAASRILAARRRVGGG